jgi:hypothetical protein
MPLEDLMAKDPAELKALVSDLEKTASSFRND